MSEEEIDFDQLGGAGPYDTKSYYLKRLKKYDKDLFVFKSKKLIRKAYQVGILNIVKQLMLGNQ